MRVPVLLIALSSVGTAPAQWALGLQFGASPTFKPIETHPALGLRALRAWNGRWQFYADAWALSPLKSSFSGIVDGRRQLASSSDSTVRYVSSEWHALPMSFAMGAMARIGKLRRSSARAHHYWCLTLSVQHTWHRQTWSSTSVYSGIRKSGDDRWSDSSILFSPGIGHRSRVHGNKRYHVELRPGLQRAVGVGYHAEVSGYLGLTAGVTWAL